MTFPFQYSHLVFLLILLLFCDLYLSAPSHRNDDEKGPQQLPPSAASPRSQSFPYNSHYYYPLNRQAEPGMGSLGSLGSGLADVVMLGLMGLPLLGLLGFVVPYHTSSSRTTEEKGRSKRDLTVHTRRDLAYAKNLLDLLNSVEMALERYGITDPQCQLRATCEIHRQGINDISSGLAAEFIRLVSRMRREIKKPEIVPLAKYVFEYYEEAAIRGEQNCNCGEMYNRCPKSLDYFLNRRKERLR